MLDDLAALFRKHPIEAGADRLVVFDSVIKQHVGRAPALLLVTPLAEHRALHLRGYRGREGQRSNAGDTGLRIFGAHEDGDLAGLLSLQRGRSAVIIVTGAVHDIGTLTKHFLTSLGAFRAIRLGVGRRRRATSGRVGHPWRSRRRRTPVSSWRRYRRTRPSALTKPLTIRERCPVRRAPAAATTASATCGGDPARD